MPGDMPHYTAAHWGIYELERTEAGPRLKPFARDPDPSPIGLDQLDPALKAMRVARPAVRESFLRGGRNGELRGREPFVEVPWDEALELVASELRKVRAQHGNRAIFGGSYGWSSAGRFHHAVGQVHRFLNMLGGYVRSVDSYSLGAGRALMPHLVTDMDDSNSSHTSWAVLAEHCQLFVSFGGVPLKNTQVSSSGAAKHRVREGLRSLARAGVRCVNISPVRDNFETGGEVEWIPIRPNTDTALMLALAYEVETQPSFDRSFVDRYCVGYSAVSAYLRGSVDGIAKTPEWAASITGVPVARIRSLAEEMRASRCVVNAAWALQRAAHGEQPFWALITLASLLGQIGLPGGGYGLGYGAMNAHGSAHARVPGPVFPQGQNAVRDFIPVARVTDMLLHPGAAFTYQGETRHYPDIRFVYWAGGNPFHHHQDLRRLERAWQRPEVIVVNEQWWTPTARRADIVLPATTTLERDDLGFATREGHYIAMRQAVPPYAEARDDHAIFAALGDKLGIDFTEGRTPREWLERMYAENAAKVAALGVTLPSFAEFWERGLIDLETHDREHVMHEAFRRDPEAHPLRTPSGKIELYSERIASFGLDDCPGYAVWREPFEWLGNVGKYPLHMLSDQPQRRLHSQLDGSAYSRAGKVAGREPVYINRQDAAAREIVDGDLVELFNDRGRCLAGAIVTDDMMPGVVRLATGSWNDFAADGLDKNANPNTLTLDRGASAFSQGCAAQTCLVELRRFEGEPPAVQVYDPPSFAVRA
ncbi:MAG: molybdopterin-dependent oxidoreductase [Polyangiales bacterium]